MSNKNDLTGLLNERLSQYLNKPVGDNLTRSVIKYFKANNNRTSFLQYLGVIGLSDEAKAEDIYTVINSNIGLLESLVNEEVKEEHNGINGTSKKTRKKTNKSTFSISFDDDDSRIELTDDNTGREPSFETSRIKRDIIDELPDLPDPRKAVKKTFKFKKIAKADALNIKNDVHIPETPSEVQKTKDENTQSTYSNKKLSLNELANLERKSQADRSEVGGDSIKFDETILEDDKDWYMADDLGNAPTAEMDDLDESNFLVPSPRILHPRRKGNTMTGGMFDERTGEYIDFDHDLNEDDNLMSKIDILYTFNIPPFLDESKNDLILQMGDGSKSFKVGPAVNPIKDSTSELAVIARDGSLVVKERKTKKERAKKAEERSSITGTAMGNVLGVQTNNQKSSQEPSSHEKDKNSSNWDDNVPDPSVIRKQRISLPAYSVKSELVRTIVENQVTVVIGETGSGKTTQLTQFLNEEGLGKNLEKNGIKKMIGCTQPRRVAAMSVAKRVSEEMGCNLGQEVGYAIRFEDKTNPSTTLIKYMTDGVLLREFLTDPMLENYSCVIMDEAHERSLNTDVLLGLFKKLLSRRKDLRLVVTSATMNANKFTRFFGDAPQFFIPGRTFPVDVFFSKSMCQDYVETAVKQVLTIHLQNSANGNDGDILVFMTGQEDIEVTCDLLQEKLNLLDNPPPLDVFPIYSTLPAELQKKIFKKKDDRIRKVVVATNIAETSLTVDGIKYVVDIGLVKLKVYNPKLGMDTLQVIPISLANAEQRSGRAGRTGPGVTYRLYTERAVNEKYMYSQPIPEIQRTNLSNVMLLLKSLNVDDISSFSFLDSPPKDLLSYSLYDLWTLDALDNLGNLTSLGKDMCRFPMEPTLSKLIILSCKESFHCSDEILTIVAMLSVPNVYMRSKERAKEADACREKFAVSESDHLSLLNVYNQWEVNSKKFSYNFNKVSQWCSKNFLNFKSLIRARDIRSQLDGIVRKAKLPISKSKSDEDIRRCLCASLFHQSAKISKVNIHGQPEFSNLRHSYMKMHLHPTSNLNGTNLISNYVVYHELILTSKEYMNCVTCVDPLWILSYGFKFFSVSGSQMKSLENADLPVGSMESFKKKLDEDRIKYYDLKNKKRGNEISTNASQTQAAISKFKKRRGF